MADNLVGSKLGNYRLERLLGRGRMGVVYLARDEALLRPTAVKILSWSFPESLGQSPETWFIAEARNVARVNHPHVVQIYSVARHGTYCYIAMEYVDGATADVWIGRNGPFSAEQATELLIQAASALQAAHDADVIHRDVKPENLLVGGDGKAKLGDFGMALYTPKPHAGGAGRAGTPYYTAPELWRGDVATAASDIYALGATYYYLLTGRPPFPATELEDLITAHVNANIPDVQLASGGAPPGCQDLLKRCMAKSPYDRFPTAQAVGWEARTLLRRFPSVSPASIRTAPPDSAHRQSERAGLAATFVGTGPQTHSDSAHCPSWRTFYGLGRDAFARHDGSQLPYQGEPYASLLAELQDHLAGPGRRVHLLVGASGTGRSSIAKALIARRTSLATAALVSCSGIAQNETLMARALRALGMPSSAQYGIGGGIDALVEHCLATQKEVGTPILVFDDCDREEVGEGELWSLALAAQLTESFGLLLLGTVGFAARLAQCGESTQDIAWHTHQIPALSAAQVGNYVTACLNYSRDPHSPPVLFTPDALLGIAHHSEGVPTRINELVCEILSTAAKQERRVLDSWDTWNAMTKPSNGRGSPRPADWPSKEATQVLNQYRKLLGMQPRR